MKNRTLIGLAVAAITVASSAPAAALELSELLAQSENSAVVIEAQRSLELARAQLELAEFAGDISFGLQPGVTVSTPEDGPFADQIKITGTASLVAPVGLSDAQQDAVSRAESAVTAAAAAVVRSYETWRYEIFVAYQNAWLAQVEQEILEIELETARKVVETNTKLYQSGLISLVALTASEEKALDAETAYLENARDRRITWLELALLAGLDPSGTQQLAAPAIDLGQLPTPPELTRHALEGDPAYLAQRDRVEDLETRIDEPIDWNPLDTVKASFSGFSQNVSVTYNAGSASVSGNYSFPIATIGADTTGGSGTTSTWDIGLSVSLSTQTQRERALESEALAAELEVERARLASIEDLVTLQVRSKYQQYLLTQGATEQAAAAYEKAQAALSLVQDRYEADRATQMDVLSAQTQLERAQVQVTVAQAKQTAAALALAAYAGYLPEIWK